MTMYVRMLDLFHRVYKVTSEGKLWRRKKGKPEKSGCAKYWGNVELLLLLTLYLHKIPTMDFIIHVGDKVGGSLAL